MATLPTTPLPTLGGFVLWVRNIMGVSAAYLPDGSDVFSYAYDMAYATVNMAFLGVPGPIYQQMVYNLAGHFLVLWAQDDPNSPAYPYQTVDNVEYGYFQWIRKQNNMLGPITGTVQAASDEGTSTSLVVPDQAKNLTLAQLMLTTTPWGRFYLGYAQDPGTLWGIS